MDEISTKFHPRHFLQNSPKNLKYRKCVLCGKYVSTQSHFYYCPICDFPFHKECVTTLMLSKLTINHLEIHEHTLNFIRQRNSFICDACGKSTAGILNMFGCLQCDFFIHRSCIFLPRVIRITRHSHRLSHTFRIPDKNLCCNVCRKNLTIGYGGFICIKKLCDYAIHSDCATRKDVWDGKDVEREPDEEESNSENDLVSFMEIDGRNIRHFSHDHDLVFGFHTDNEEGQEAIGKLCQACILPLDFGNILDCKQCDFSLHDTCARLPRKMEHMLHRHPLTLHVNTMKTKEGFFTCSTCDQESCGFMYQCGREGCGFKIDVKCASFVEPFYHPSKSRSTQFGTANPFSPLFLTQFGDDKKLPRCYACSRSSQTMATLERYIHYDFKCVTLPALARFKYDTHPLTLDQAYMGSMWCEICEQKISIYRFFYICKDCSTSLHVECILGNHRYLKSGHMIKVNGLEIQIASNNGVSRPICHRCHCLCQDKLVFINRIDNICFCSINCINA